MFFMQHYDLSVLSFSRMPLTLFVCLSVCAPMQRVSEGALSPDGTVLATASHDGYIKFWQIYIEGGQDKPRLARLFWVIAFGNL